MKRNFLGRVLALLLCWLVILAPLRAEAAVYFFSGCDSGADAGCVPGDDTYNGLSRYPGKLDDGVTVNAAYGPKKDWFGFDFGTKAAGDQFKMAKGSAIYQYKSVSGASSTVFSCGACAPSTLQVNWTGHGLVAGTTLLFTTTGAFPTGSGIGGTTVGGVVKTVTNANQFTFAYGTGSGAFSATDSGTGTVTVNTSYPTVQNNNATAANPIVFDSYDPPNWTSSGNKPVIISNGTAGQGCLKFSQGGTSSADGGYTVRNLKFTTASGFVSGDQSVCFFVAQESNYITLDNLDISGFSTAVQLNGYFSCCTTGDGTSKNFILRNSNIHDNGDMGILGGDTNGALIEHNTFDNNGFSTGSVLFKNHHIYMSGTYLQPLRNTTIRHNHLTRNSVCQAATTLGGRCNSSADYGQCQGSTMVFHGIIDKLVLEDNYIEETLGATDTCYGMDISPGYASAPDVRDANEIFTGVVIRNNKIVNVGSAAITCTSCVNPKVYGNQVVWTLGRSDPGQGVSIGTSANYHNGTGGNVDVDAIDTGAEVYNNSVYVNSTATNSVGVMVKSQSTGSTSGVKVNNNAVYYASAVPSTVKCFDWTGLASPANVSSWDRNLCYRVGGAATWSQSAATLAGQPSPFDQNSLNTDPSLTTPAVGNSWSIVFGTTNTGTSAVCPKLDGKGRFNNGSCDIGAIKNSATVVAPDEPALSKAQ
jgi:hypothetical protein